jgi:acetoin utilization deacetylase AcuC-like enzyme
MVLASDKIAAIRKTVVSVDFDIHQGNTVRSVTMEMTKEELKNLISSLEAANKVWNIFIIKLTKLKMNLGVC